MILKSNSGYAKTRMAEARKSHLYFLKYLYSVVWTWQTAHVWGGHSRDVPNLISFFILSLQLTHYLEAD
jgi:hypothetical protein